MEMNLGYKEARVLGTALDVPVVIDDYETDATDDSKEYDEVYKEVEPGKFNFNKHYYNEKHEMGTNVLLPYNQLCQFVKEHTFCHKCYRRKEEAFVASTCEMTTVGIATTITISMCANHKHNFVIAPDEVSMSDDCDVKQPRGKSIGHYVVNLIGVLMSQMLGHGYIKTISTVAGCLGIPFHISNRVGWRAAESLLGNVESMVSRQICDKNKVREIELSLADGVVPNNQGEVGISVSTDMGWQVRSAGRTYASNSGHNLCIGCRSGKILDYVVLSKTCSTCVAAKAKDTIAKEHECVHNHNGSSKSMEPLSTCDLATRLYRNEIAGTNTKIYVNELLTDDDSTTRSNMKTVGRRKSDKGKLPPDVPQPTRFLTDPSHRTRVYAKHFYALIGQHGMKPGHFERFKKYHAFAVQMYRHEELPSFRNRVVASVEHVFNNHTFCDETWCRYKHGTPARNKNKIDRDIVDLTTVSGSPSQDEDEPIAEQDINISDPIIGSTSTCKDTNPFTEKRRSGLEGDKEREEEIEEEEKGREVEIEEEPPEIEAVTDGPFLSKIGNPLLYAAIKAIQEKYLTDKNLDMLLHKWNTQRNEAMNNCISKLAPKDQTHSHTPDLGYRVSLAVGFKSVGWVNYLSKVFSVLQNGRRDPLPPTMKRMLANKQQQLDYSIEYKSRLYVRLKRRKKSNEKINVQKVHDRRDNVNHTSYRSGIGVHTEEDELEQQGNAKKAKKSKTTTTKICKSCGKSGHCRISHADCDSNPKNKPQILEK
jgi:hypothetical protein